MKFFTLLFLTILLSFDLVTGEECPEKRSGYLFPRSFLMFQNGPLDYHSLNKTSLAWALGSCCVSMNVFADRARGYLESKYNIDFSGAKSPFNYETDEFAFSTYYTEPNVITLHIVLETFYEYAKTRYTPVKLAGFVLNSKTDISSSPIPFKANSTVGFGVLRFNVHGREFCVHFNDNQPMAKAAPGSVIPRDLHLNNKYWGDGSLRGAGVVTQRDGAFWVDASHVMKWPKTP